MLKRVFAIVITSFIAIASISVSGQTIDELMQGANNNDEYSMFFLGYCYSVGEGITQNKEEARKWWEKLAEKTLTHKNKKYIAKAQWQLGNYYEEIRQIQKAMDWWGKAAKNGDTTAKKKLDDYKSNPAILTHSDEEITANGVPFKMVFVSGGSFTMGGTAEQGSDAENNEQPAHNVTIGDYYIADTEVTQQLWEAVMGTTIYMQRDKADPNWPTYGVGDNHPMYYVSWEEANQFCEKLSALTGKIFRLPTEAEWEYAARGGGKSQGYKYAGGNSADAVAWFSTTTSDKGTEKTRSKVPNELTLYDMSGNVCEWCSDWYGDSFYATNTNYNPTGPATGSCHIRRGGSWSDDSSDCRVSCRHNYIADGRYGHFGFRIVMQP